MARIYKKNNSYYFCIEAGKDKTGKRQRVTDVVLRQKRKPRALSLKHKFLMVFLL